jgi:hypothetical protein
MENLSANMWALQGNKQRDIFDIKVIMTGQEGMKAGLGEMKTIMKG